MRDRLLVVSWMMDRAELAIYESPDAFIRSAKPYADHGPRLAYNMGIYPSSRTQRMFDDSALLQKAYRDIFMPIRSNRRPDCESVSATLSQRLGHRVASFKLPANARTSEAILPRSSRFSPTQRTSALPVIAPSAPAANTA